MTLVLAIFALLAQNAAGAQASTTASLQGTVVRAGAGDPLSKATVELREDDIRASPLRLATGSDGRFAFQNLKPGRYQLVVTRSGYVRSPMVISLAAGQQVRDLQVSMTPSTAIFGHVYDDRGGPAGGVEVRALKATYPEGRRTLTVVRSVITNDLGEYRLFWLPPGRYYVSAFHPGPLRLRGGSFGGGRGGPDGVSLYRGVADPAVSAFVPVQNSEEHYVPVYFPGTFDERDASAIDLRAGTDFGEVNLVAAPVNERRVRGTIIDGATGRPAQFAGLRRSTPRNEILPGASKPFEDVDPTSGAFEVALLPGSHTLMATAGSGVGYAVIQVADADLDNVTIVTAPVFSLSARIVVEGRSGNNPDLGNLRVSLRRDPAIPGTSSSSYSVPQPTGSFALEAGPGNFRVNLAPLLNLTPSTFVTLPRGLEGAFVKSIRLGSADVLNDGLHLERPPDVPLEIVIGTTPGAIDGRLAAERRDQGADVSVALVPEVRRRVDLYRSVPPDGSGRFRFDRVPPGDYRIFAWSDVESGAWLDPGFMRAHENRGTPVRVSEGTTENVEVTVIQIQ